jgi:hypothetical protein
VNLDPSEHGAALSEFKGSPVEYSADLKLAIERGWLWLHESGTYVKLTPADAGSWSGEFPRTRAVRSSLPGPCSILLDHNNPTSYHSSGSTEWRPHC